MLKRIFLIFITMAMISTLSFTMAAAESNVSVYDEVIRKYKTAQDYNFYKYDIETLNTADINSELVASAYSDSELYYSLIDFADDGEPELVIAAKSSYVPNDYYAVDYIIYDMYGYENGEVVRLFDNYSMGYRMQYFIMNNGVISINSSGGAYNSAVYYYSVPKNSAAPQLIKSIGYDGSGGVNEYFETVNEAKTLISEAEYNSIIASYTYADVEWLSVVGYANPDIKVVLDGSEIVFDQPPVMIRNRTMVPIRAIFEAMGYSVDWNNETQTATAVRGANIITVKIGDVISYVLNGQAGAYDSEAPPQIVSGRTLVPVRAIATYADCTVDWDGDTQTVIITTN